MPSRSRSRASNDPHLQVWLSKGRIELGENRLLNWIANIVWLVIYSVIGVAVFRHGSQLSFMLVVFLSHNLTAIVVSMAAAFFCAELTIGPMWSIPMDVAPKYSGTASGLMNTGSAVAAALSPTAFGYIVDWTGNWQLPFILSLGLLLVGAGLSFKMRPEVAFEDEPAVAATLQ